MSPAMPLDDYESVHFVAREGNCPKADDSDGTARWVIQMIRAKSPEEAASSEYSLHLDNAISRDISLTSLITRLLRVRRLCATIHASSSKTYPAPHEYVRRRCAHCLSTGPPSICCSLCLPQSRAAGS